MLDSIANRYQVVEELGVGGMGVVYRVIDTLDDGRELALKTIRADKAISAERRLRFREEFRAMSRLRHPNTVEVRDCGFIDGRTEYLTMEYVPGCELSDLIADGPLGLERVYDLTLQLLLGLEFIHSRFYIHRDIKPSNLRLRNDGVLKIMDFGLMEWAGSRSLSGIAGTAAYMAPESLLGGVIDTKADLYSVGCVLFEMLTGQVPFRGSRQAVFEAHLREQPPRLRMLRSELPPQLESLVESLLAKHPRARPQSASAVADTLAALAGAHRIRQDLRRSESYLVSDSLIGRSGEFERLEQLWAESTAGQRRSAFIAGPAGVGKSRLMQEVMLRARLAGAQLCYAVCEQGMGSHEPLVRALTSLLELSEAEELEHDRRRLAKLGPERSSARAALTASDRQQLGLELGEWVAARANRVPIVIALDDLHRADLPSLGLLNRLIHALDQSRVLIVATFRDDETSLDSPLWFTIEDSRTEKIKLRPFTSNQVGELVESMLRAKVPESFVSALFDATAGNAFFVTEVLRDLMEQGTLVAAESGWTLPTDWQPQQLPQSIDAVVLDRLARLDREVLHVAQLAAIIGRYQSREALLHLSGLEEGELFARLDVLAERQLLTREDRRYAFPHDRVRETLYADIPGSLRRALHQRCGEYLEHRNANDLDAVLEELAHHFAHGEDSRKAFDYTRRAGDRARASGAEATAIDYWERAIGLLEHQSRADKARLLFELRTKLANDAIVTRPRLTIELANRCRKQLEARGNVDLIFAGLNKIVAMIERAPARIRGPLLAELQRPRSYAHTSPTGLLGRLIPPIPTWAPQLLETYIWASVSSGLAGKPKAGLELGQRALDLMPFKGTPLEGSMMAACCQCHQAAGHFDEIDRTMIRVRELLFRRDVGTQDFLRSARVGAAVFSNYRVFQGKCFNPEYVEYGLWAADELDKPDFYNQIWAYPCIWYAWTGRHTQARELLDRIIENCRKIGAPPFPWALYLAPFIAWQQGQLERARAMIIQTLRYPHIDRMMVARESTCVLLGHVHLDCGEVGAAQELFAATEARARRAGMDLIWIQTLIGQGELAARHGETEHAASKLRQALERAEAGPARNPLHEAIARRVLAGVEVSRGRLDHAERHLDRAHSIARSKEQDNLIQQGLIHLSWADLFAVTGDGGAEIEQLERAASVFDSIGNPVLLARVHERFGERKVRPGASVVHPSVGGDVSAHEDTLLASSSRSTASSTLAESCD